MRSPIAGQVLEVHTQAGEVVGANGILSIGRTDSMYVTAEVYETDVGRLQLDQKAMIASEYGGFSGELTGTVEEIGLQINRNSLFDPNPSARSDVRVIEVKIRLSPEDSERVKTLTNLQVRVRIESAFENVIR